MNTISHLTSQQQVHYAAVVNDPRETEFETRIVEAAKKLGRQIVVAMLDDELLYRTALHGLVGKNPDVAASVRIDFYDKSSEILKAAVGSDCVVCDIDLATTDPMDGFTVVRKLRKQGFFGQICVHSNRSSPEDTQKGLNAGANLVLPKPMSRAHLLGFVGSTISEAPLSEASISDTSISKACTDSKGSTWQNETPTTSQPMIKPTVVVLDDDAVVHRYRFLAW